MKYTLSSLLSVAAVAAVSLFGALPVHAASPAVIHIHPNNGTTGPGDINVEFTVDSPDQALSIVKVVVPVPAGLTYKSIDVTGGVMSSTITGAAVSSGVLSFTYGRFDTGYTGTGGKLATVTFSATDNTTYAFALDTANSQALAYADSSNILTASSDAADNAVSNVAATATPTPTPAATATPTATPTATAKATKKPTLVQTGDNSLAIFGGGVLLTGLLFFLARKRY